MPKGVKIQDNKTMSRFRTVVQNSVPFSLKINKNIARFSEFINEKTKNSVSISTLKRLFIYPDATTPSQYTLDIICRAIGYKSWNDFVENESHISEYLHIEIINTIRINGYQNFDEFEKFINDNASSPHIFEIILTLIREAMKNNDINTLSRLFNIAFFNKEISNDPAQFYFIHEFGIIIREFDGISQLITCYAKNSNAQRWYIERYVDEEKLDGYYGEMLEIYHLHKKNTEAQLFYHSLMCMRDVEKGIFNSPHYDFLLQFREVEPVHYIPKFRRLALLLLYFHDDQEVKDGLLEEIPDLLTHVDLNDKSFLALIFCQIVFHKRDYYSLKRMFNYIQLSHEVSFENIHLYRNLNILRIYEAFVLLGDKKPEEAKKKLLTYNVRNPFRQELFGEHYRIVRDLIEHEL